MKIPELVHFDPERHYGELCRWWVGHKWPAIPLDFLPRTGLVVEGVAAGFLYNTDSRVAMLEWIVSNPDASPWKVVPALNLIVQSLTAHAKHEGYVAVFSFIRNEGLKKLYQKSGYEVTDTGMTHVLWRNK